uniref:Uncharacterized protein n=1 Tax=Cajanus cajan TaxID=3821 RepID=A0A151RKM0_CAJCA|nr:hypothetical protein KK1_035442 [Cajanus cajan]
MPMSVFNSLSLGSHYYFLDGFSGYFQVHITLEDQEKIIFTYPFNTFAYFCRFGIPKVIVSDQEFPYGIVEIRSESSDKSFKVNGHRLKHFHESPSLVDVTMKECALDEPIIDPP